MKKRPFLWAIGKLPAVELAAGILLWRGSLLPLGREVAQKTANPIYRSDWVARFAAAAQPNGSKLPRHNGGCVL
ncbi:hypothetical protein DJ564_02280 [Pseudomonas sp. 31-12]|nr:hypothetical protein DJ564_02280 [Pseudomonas sp. 31-12]